MLSHLFSRQDLSVSSTRVSLGLLALRIVVGAALMAHGFGKIQSPFSWMGPDAPIPGILLALAALAEFGGGLALIIGVLVPLASAGIAVTMAVAMFFHINKGDAFVGGWELATVFLSAAILFLLTGAGRFAVDAKLRFWVDAKLRR